MLNRHQTGTFVLQKITFYSPPPSIYNHFHCLPLFFCCVAEKPHVQLCKWRSTDLVLRVTTVTPAISGSRVCATALGQPRLLVRREIVVSTWAPIGDDHVCRYIGHDQFSLRLAFAVQHQFVKFLQSFWFIEI
jgi:hypothetical protein